jgi:hypothetical protein
MVLAWSVAQQRMVTEFAFTLTEGPWVIPADKLAQLPAGINNLQLHVRTDTDTVKRVTRDVAFVAEQEPAVEEAASEPETDTQSPAPEPERVNRFAATFADADLKSYTLGSGQSVPLKVTGEMFEGQDLMVLAWSVAEQRVVTEFAFTLTEGPWVIPADKLAQLPAGVNNIQLHVRTDDSTVKRVNRDIEFIKPVVPFQIGFGDAPAAYELGSGKSINLVATGDLAEDADVLVLAWSVEQSKMVDNFAFTLDGSTWTIPAGKLDALPEGKNEIQLIIRDDKRTKLTHSLTVSAPAPVIPELSLPAGSSFIQGQATQAMPVQLDGDVPDGGTLVVQAWSSDQERMIPEIVHTLNSDQPVIAAEKLNLLPVGQNNVRVQLRMGGEVLKQVSADVAVAPVPEPPKAQDPATEQPASEDPAPTDPVATLDPVVQFVDKPGTYTLGSSSAIGFDVQNLPEGGDVLVIAWSDAQGGLVDAFAHTLKAGPWQISAARMNKLPAGKVELQLIVRGGDSRPKVTHRAQIIAPAADPTTDPNTDPTTDPTTNPSPGEDGSSEPTTDPTTDPITDPTTDPTSGGDSGAGNESGSDGGSSGSDDTPVTAPDLSDFSSAPVGFTTLTKHADTRVIYVSNSQGKDTNDGLSESKPVKTLDRGMQLLRNGKPDWMLLKAGDVWEGQTLTVDKGGAGDDKPMVIGAYGDGPRPMIIPAHGKDGVHNTNQFIRGLVLQGLHIYGATRDPGSPKFIDRPGRVEGISMRINSSQGRYITGLVIEDCIITHFDDNILVVDDWARNQGEGVAGRVQVTIRRNIVRYATSTDSHSVGIYLEGTHDSVVEQNLIDHNGWAQTDDITIRNKRSHNIYAQRFNGPITLRHNILARAACAGLQLRAGGTIEHNLFVRNATAFWTSINDSKALYNVVIESEDMNPDVGDMKRGMGIEGWGMDRYEVIGNVVARSAGSLERPGIDVTSSVLVVKNNVVYDWADDRTGQSINAPGAQASGNLSQESFGGNEPPFVDPTRNVDRYAGTIGLKPTLDAFLDAAASRPRGQWVEELAPDAVCRYIRNGFELMPHD